MRVIAGKARSLNLKTVPGMDVRPTTDRIKETLFNMLSGRIPGARFLDLFAGSGGIGIEALSRGAEKVIFVDQSRAAVQCIRENLTHTKLSADAEVIQQDVLSAIALLERRETAFDIIFMDPPYDRGLEREVLLKLEKSPLADENTLIVTEALLDTEFDYLEGTSFRIVKNKEYKTNKHVFLERNI